MAEWLKAHAWKACVRETVPWVRIPLSPPPQLRPQRHPWPSRPKSQIKTTSSGIVGVRENSRFWTLVVGDGVFLQSLALRQFGTVFKGSHLRCFRLRSGRRFRIPVGHATAFDAIYMFNFDCPLGLTRTSIWPDCSNAFRRLPGQDTQTPERRDRLARGSASDLAAVLRGLAEGPRASKVLSFANDNTCKPSTEGLQRQRPNWCFARPWRAHA
jgi:hypothetical protein